MYRKEYSESYTTPAPMYRKEYSESYTTPAPMYRKEYSESYKYSATPQVNWGFFISEEIVNRNQEHQKIKFSEIDCELNKQIVFYDWENINFGQDYIYEWTDKFKAEKFLEDLSVLRKRCPDVKVSIDPEFIWNNEIADQIAKNKVSVSQLAKSLTDFTVKYNADGFVISNRPGVVLNDKITYEFLKELRRLFSQNKLKLFLGYGPRENMSYVRPLAFEFADLIFIYTFNLGSANRNTLEHQSPTYSNDWRSASGIIDLFINMGVQKSKISLLVNPYGFSFKRIKSTSETEIGCPAAGVGSLIYPGNTIVVEGKNTSPFSHDLPTVCQVINNPEWTKKYDDVAQVPYAFNDEQWMGYEDEKSIKAKADIVKEKGIGGVTIFMINSDDINNRCGNGEYSFIRAFANEFAYSD